ncbi:MAG: T9SS type B sorting domain-containing protein [Chitinophagaceae bacterium]|nr:MAG: T9SS type B sorting domain-containing protein [Chitinophagaceae bacterium]
MIRTFLPNSLLRNSFFSVVGKRCFFVLLFVCSISLVAQSQAPANITYNGGLQWITPNATKGTPLNLVPSAGTGGTPTSYSISPSLPGGAVFNTGTGVISGTRSAITSPGIYRITATNASGSTTFDLAFGVDDVPSFSGIGIETVIPAAVFSVRKVNSGYNGFAMLVRRKSDDAVKHIGFTAGGDLDTVALKNFVGTSVTDSGFVQVWYNQSGAVTKIDSAQLIPFRQPIIIGAGKVLRSGTNNRPTLIFNGGRWLTSKANVPVNGLSTFSANAVAMVSSTAGTYGRIISVRSSSASSDEGGIGNGSLLNAHASNAYLGSIRNGNFSGDGPSTFSLNTLFTAMTMFSPSGGGFTDSIVSNLRPISRVVTTSSGGNALGSNMILSLGWSNVASFPTNNGNPLNGGISEVLLLPSLLPVTANSNPRVALPANQASYYGITVTAPSGISYPAFKYYFGKNIPVYVQPTNSSSGAATTFSVSPALPAGLTFNTATGIITGIPTVTSSLTTYTVTASNTAGSTTASFSMAVDDTPDYGAIGLTGVNATAIYSLRKLNASYTGPAISIQVRAAGSAFNSTVLASGDIGFDANGTLDTVAMKTLVAGGDAYISLWYDQSGKNRTMQAYPGGTNEYPLIMATGVIKTSRELPTLDFNWSGQTVLYTNETSVDNAASAYANAVLSAEQSAPTAALLASYSSGSNGNGTLSRSSLTYNNFGFSASGGTNSINGAPFATGGAVPALNTLYIGTFKRGSTATSGYEQGGGMYIGRQVGGGHQSLNGFLSELLVLPAITTAQKTSMESSQAAYYFGQTLTSPTTTSVCSGQALSYTATAGTGGTFTWSRAVVVGISNAASLNNVSATITETLVNTTATAIAVPYTLTFVGESTGFTSTYSLVVTVNPTPQMSAGAVTVCSGVALNYTPTGTAVPAGTVYAWSNPVVSVSNGTITGASAQAGQTSITQVLTSSSTTNGTVTYTITPSAAGCNGNNFTVTVPVQPPITNNTINTSTPSICSGVAPAAFTAGTPAGGNGSFTYLWESSTDGVSFATASGTSNTATYAPGVLTQTTWYRRRVMSASCAANVSAAFQITVNVTVPIGVATQPVSQTICNNTTANLTVTATGSNGVYAYQWYSNSSNSNTGGTSLGSGSGAQTASYTVPATATAGNRFYYVEITDLSCGESIKSNAVTITTRTALGVGSLANPTYACYNTTLDITLAGTGATLSYTYQWYSNTTQTNTGGTSLGIGSGAQTATYTVPASVQSGTSRYYYVTITDAGGCGTVTSAAANIYTRYPLALSTIPTRTICNNASTILTQTPGGAGGGFSYQWYSNSINSYTGSSLIPDATSATYTVPANSTAGNRYYYVEVNSTICPETPKNSNISTIITSLVLTIGTQPAASTTICNNTTANLTVVGAGGSGVSYQWFSNNSNSNTGGTSLGSGSGAQTATYTVPATATAGDRYYYVVISDTCGVTLSSNVAVVITRSVLTVATPPVASQTVCNNTATSLTVAGTGGSGSYTYQWFSNSSNSNTGGTSLGSGSGAQTATYTVPATTTAGNRYYYAQITDVTCGVTVSSSAATVTTFSLPGVGTQPASITICNNTTTNLTLAGSGGSGVYTYQWYSNGSNSNTGGTSLGSGSGAQTATYTVAAGTAVDDRYYYAVITDVTCSVSVSTAVAIVSTRGVMSIALQPVSQTICNNSTVAISTAVTSGSLSYTYQWYSNSSNSNTGGSIVPGANSASYTVPGSSTAGNRYYYAVITDAICGDQQITNAVTITTRPVLSAGVVPVNQIICNNTSIDVSVSGTGGSGVYTYQWYNNSSNSNTGGTHLGSDQGANTGTYTIPATTLAGDRFYYVEIRDVGCSQVVNTAAFTVTTGQVLSIQTQPQTQVTCNNSPVNLSVLPIGGTGVYTYQWFSNTVNSNTGGSNLGSGARTASYTVPATVISGDRYYYVVITDASCGETTKSAVAKITTGIALSVGTQPLSQLICNNTTIAISAAGAGASLSYTYQWYSNSSNSNSGGTLIPGAVSGSYTVPATAVAGDRYFYAVITDASCGLQVTTQAVTVSTRSPFAVATHPVSQTICYNTTVDLSIAASGGSGTYTYQWYSNVSNSNNGGVSLGSTAGANTAVYSVPATVVSGNRYYYAVITDPVCGVSVTTDPADLLTRTALGIVTQPQALQTVVNNTAASISVTAGGASGSYSYQWYAAPSNTNTGGTAITGATATTYTIPATAVAGSRYYYALVTDLTCGNSVASAVAELVTTASLSFAVQPLSQSVCNNTATTLSVQTSGGSNVYTYQWYSNAVSSTVGATLLSGATAATYTVPATNLVNDRYYYVVVSDVNLGNNQTSNLAKIITLTGTPVVVNTQPASNTAICVSGTISLRVAGIGGSSGTFVYQWYSNTTASNTGGTLIAGATGDTYTRSFSTAGTQYFYATVADPACGGSVSSNVATVVVRNSPTVSVTPDQQTVCQNAMAVNAEAVITDGAGTATYQWFVSNTNTNEGGANLGADNGARTLSFTPASATLGTQYYYMEAAFSGNGCGVAKSNTHQVTVRYVAEAADIVISTPSVNLCKGLSTSLRAALSASSSIQDPVFTWYADANFTTQLGTGADFVTPVLNSTTTYYVKVSGSNACENLPGNGQSQTITVTQQAPELVQPSNLTYCTGVTTSQVSFTSSVPGTTYSWQNNTTSIGLSASGNENITPFLTVNNTLTNAVASISVTPFANGCVGVTKSFTITVVPNALVNDTSFVVCSGSPVNYTPTRVPLGKKYSWVLVSVPVAISGATANAVPAVSFSQTLTNTSALPANVVYAVTPDGCSDRTFTVTVTVNPVPQISNQSLTSAICNGAGFSFSDFAGIIPAGTLYTWTAPGSSPLGAVTGGISQPVQQSVVSEKNLYHSRSDIANALYQITPYSSAILGGCVGQPFTLTVPVNPKPVLVLTSAGSICNHTAAVFNPSSLTAGVSYSWKRAKQAQISNEAASGVNGFSEVLHNTGTAPVLVDYEYTLTVNGCSNTQIVQVLVNPDPVLNSPTSLSVCSGALLNYSPSSLTNGTTFTWSRPLTAGIKNTPNAGASDIFEALVNTTNIPVVVSYRFTLTANGCTHSEDLLVTVNPIPMVSESVEQVVCNGSKVQVNFSGSLIGGTEYNWTNTNSNIGLASSGKGNLSFTAVNRISLAQTGYITVEPVANGCSGTTKGFYIVVNPTPALSSSITPQAVCSNTVFNYMPESSTEGVSFSWSRAVVNGISNAAATGTGLIRETLVSTTNTAIQVPYEITLTANGCSAKRLVVVTVNPTPVVASVSNKVFCNNSVAVVNFSGSAVSNSSYTWTNDNTDLGIMSEGWNDLFFVANNTTSKPLVSNITVTPEAEGCKGTAVAFTITISPSLKLKSATSLPAVCSNSLLTYEPLVEGDTSAIVTWTRPSIYGISNRPASGTGIISENLVNTTALPVLVTYILTITNKNCSSTENISVQVNPAVTITNSSSVSSVCSNELFLFSPASGVTTAQLEWTREAVAGISNAAASGKGDITEMLTNTTAAPIDVLYKYSILQSSACSNDQFVKVTVKPVPKLASVTTLVKCSNEPVSYNPVSNVSGTNFSWSRLVMNGIANNSASGTGAISESLVNKSLQPLEISYQINLKNTNGCSNTDTLLVTVKPNPTANVIADQSVCKDGRTQAVQFTGDQPNTVFNWTNSETGIGLAASGTGNIASFIARNAGATTLSAFIEVVPELNGCKGTATSVLRINVNPGISSHFIEMAPAAACPGQLVGPLVASYPNGGDGISYAYQWMISNDGLNYTPLSVSGSANRRFYAPAQTRDNWYKMMVSSGGCTAYTDSVKVKMGVTPVVTVSNRENYTISIGNATQVIASGATNYEWTPRSFVSDPFSANPFLNPVTDNTRYIVKGTNEDGCSDTASVVIKVVQGYSIMPQNILTPNGDGYNDTWEIKNISHYSNNSIIIYNRNGVRVFGQENYTGGWKGVSDSGAKLATEVYYYVIKLKSTTGEVVVKGYLNIFN